MPIYPVKGLLLSLVAVAASCQTALAPTTHLVQTPPGLEGQWMMSLDGDEDEWLMEMELVDLEPQGGLAQMFGVRPQAQEARYRAEARLPEGFSAPPEMTFDCQVVEAAGKDYLTFQKAPGEGQSAFIYLFEVPLQNTLRIELEGDELTLLAHQNRYLWVPMAHSGEFEVNEPDEVGGMLGILLPSLDAVLDAYGNTRDDDWKVLCRGKRTGN